MKTSETIIKIAPALLKAQKSIGSAKKGANNPFFHSKYADLGAVMEACKEALNDNGISVIQPIMGDMVETVLIHESGEWMMSETRIISKEQANPQSYGSACTYARRYGLQSMVFIPAEDDDAEKATVHNDHLAGSNFPDDTPVDLGKCPKCGAPMKMSKTGNKFCSKLCWKNYADIHTDKEELYG